jgi:uncharacterized protein (DUF305 family)
VATLVDPPGTGVPAPAAPPARRRGPRAWQVVALVAAIAFLAGVVGWRVAQPSHPGAGSTDVGFLTSMVEHHSQAIEMGLAYQRHGDDPLLGHMAREVVTSQGAEIGWMNYLLSDWGHAGVTADDMAWMGMPGPMPGMATRAELDRLEQLEGLALDDVFSRLMIRHHEGGLHMADHAAEHAESGELRRRARAMAEGQRSEIAEIDGQRRALGLAPVA